MNFDRRVEFELKNGKSGIIRVYKPGIDTYKMITHLFMAMNENQMKESDKFFTDDPANNIRIVAEINNELYGTTTIVRDTMVLNYHRAVLYSVVVSPQYMGSSLASKIIEESVIFAKNLGIKILLVSTWETNKRAIAFYKKMGFEQYGTLPYGIPSHGGDGFETEILFWKSIGEDQWWLK